MNESVYVRPMAEADLAAGRLLLDQLGYDLTSTEMRRRYAVIAYALDMPFWLRNARRGRSEWSTSMSAPPSTSRPR
jgi:hypothetical protein